MKILMINHFPLAGSGSGTYTRNLAVQLVRSGHDVSVVLPENTEDYQEVEGVKIHPVFFSPLDDTIKAGTGKGTELGKSMDDALPFNFPCFTTHPRSTVSFGDLSEEQLAMYIKAFSEAIKDEVEHNRPDIVHGQHVWILPDLATGYGIPIVLTAHGTDLMGYDKWPEMRKYAEHVVSEASRVISISEDNLELLTERFPEEKEKFVRKRNGYDPSVFYPEDLSREDVLADFGITKGDLYVMGQAGAPAPNGEPASDGALSRDVEPGEPGIKRRLVAFAGKLTAFKGVDILLDAVKIIEDKGGIVPLFIIAGDGEEREALKKQAERLGLSAVRFLGNVDQDTLRKLYSVSDMDVVPSRREPFGLVAIEAMACGIPVVASDQGGLPDFVNESVGALARPEDPGDLADKIVATLARLEEKAGAEEASWKKEIAGYARESYAQDKIIEELVELYNDVIKEG